MKWKTQNEKKHKILPRQKNSRKPCRGRKCFSPGSCYHPGLKVLQPAALGAATWRAFSPGSWQTGTKGGGGLESRLASPGWKTGTKASSDPGLEGRSTV